MSCEMFLIGSLAGLALTAGALALQFLNNIKKGEPVKEIEKEEKGLTAITAATVTNQANKTNTFYDSVMKNPTD